MKRQVARSKIWARLMDGLNAKSNCFERLQFTELRRFHAALDLPLLADQQLILQDQFQELRMVELMASRFLQADIERLGQPRQSQLV